MKYAWITLIALVALACTTIEGKPGEEQFRASTFGSGSVEVVTDSDGSAVVTAKSDGTNVLGIFSVLTDGVAAIFGGAPPEVTVNVPAPEQPEE